MKETQVVVTKNLRKFKTIYGDLLERTRWMPGLGLVTGEPGLGKTTAIIWLANQTNCVVITANAVFSPNALLDAILAAFGHEKRSISSARKYDLVVQEVVKTQRPIVVDECDQIIDCSTRKRQFELLRSIHDATGVPVILVGTPRLKTHLAGYEQIDGRFSRQVRFELLDAADVLLVLKAICDVPVTLDMAEKVLRVSGGYVRRVIIAGMAIDAEAKLQGWQEINATSWANRPIRVAQEVA